MRIVTTSTDVYKFDELDEKAKQKAIEWFLSDYPDHEWWDCTYEDAKTIGLALKSFDLDRNRHATGKFINDAETCAKAVIENHGEQCETYKTAKAFLLSMDSLNTEYPEKEEGENAAQYEGEKEDLEDEFLKSLLEDYAMLLQKEYEYLCSEEHALDMIQNNNYEFTKEGAIF